MKRCPSCGETLAGDANFCFACRWREVDGPPARPAAARPDPLPPPPRIEPGPERSPPASSSTRTADPPAVVPPPPRAPAPPPPQPSAVPDPREALELFEELLATEQARRAAPSRQAAAPAVPEPAPAQAVEPPRVEPPRVEPPEPPPAPSVQRPVVERRPPAPPPRPEPAPVQRSERGPVRPPEPAPVDRAPPWATVAIVGVSALLAAAVVGALAAVVRPPSGAPPGEVIAEAPIGPGGATVRLLGGGRVEVPPGAIEVRTTLVVRSLDPDEVGDLAGRRVAGDRVLSFAPRDVRFRVPIRVILPAPSGDAVAAVVSGGRAREITGDYDEVSGLMTIRTTSLDFGADG